MKEIIYLKDHPKLGFKKGEIRPTLNPLRDELIKGGYAKLYNRKEKQTGTKDPS